jgi:multicomponent Na+:H+ antiporter subunit C
MDNWFEFALGRYNYWIAISLMMMGLYIVFARGNLVKKIVGLNLFQTSVFIFYITIGKIAGGTAPIYMNGELEHGEAEGGAEEGLHDPLASEVPENSGVLDQSESLHSKIDNPFGDAPANDLKAALNDLGPAQGADAAPSLHDVPVGDAGKISNDALSSIAKPDTAGFDTGGLDIAGAGNLHDTEMANTVGESFSGVVHGSGEMIYSNPLPHVLILTAIVVGVATTAVGLALAVRIREAYGTIEEDELEAIDDVAEFGDAGGSAA